MEKLKNSKFQKLSEIEMSKIEGGKWGWYCDNWKKVVLPDGSGASAGVAERYNIWGNPTGDYKAVQDTWQC